MAISVTVDTQAFISKLTQSLNKIKTIAGDASEEAAQSIIDFARKAPIPREEGHLDNSSFIERKDSGEKVTVTFGFRKVYAVFQDGAGIAFPVTITPKGTKKWLFIALSPAARRHVRGANPSDEGLAYGKDYILARKVVINAKSFGDKKGPNFYFSGTLRERVSWFYTTVSKKIAERTR